LQDGSEVSTIEKTHVVKAMEELLKDFAHLFEVNLRMLPVLQGKLLECLAIEPTSQPHSKEYRKKYNLPRGGSLSSALNGLTSKGLIYGAKDGYALTTPFLASWVKRNRLKKLFH
jgi:hypothetical protein